MLTSSMIKQRIEFQRRRRFAFVAGVMACMSRFRTDPGRMPAAWWQVTPLCTSVEMFSACAHEAHTISEEVGSGISGGKMKSITGNTISCTIAVLPEPPCPMSRICFVFLRSTGMSSRSSFQAASHASAKRAKKHT